MVERVEVEPTVLEWALNRSKRDPSELDNHAVLKHIHEWIDGSKNPTMRQLQTFANWTHVPFGNLFLTEPPEVPLPLPDFRTFKNSPPETSANLTDTIHWVEVRRDWYIDYLRRHDEEAVNWVASIEVGQDPESAADRIRETLGIFGPIAAGFSRVQDAINSICKAIEQAGALVLISGVAAGNNQRPLDPEEFRGFSIGERFAPLIFVNGADTKNGQVFTLAHELAHLFTGTTGVSNPDYRETGSNRIETWCNRVAAELLMPSESCPSEKFHGEVPRRTLDTLARQFNVSTVMTLVRLRSLNLVTQESFDSQFDPEVRRAREFAAIAKSKAKNGGGSWYNNQVIRLGRTLTRSLAIDTFEGGTSYGDALRIAGTRKPDTFRRLAETAGV